MMIIKMKKIIMRMTDWTALGPPLDGAGAGVALAVLNIGEEGGCASPGRRAKALALLEPLGQGGQLARLVRANRRA